MNHFHRVLLLSFALILAPASLAKENPATSLIQTHLAPLVTDKSVAAYLVTTLTPDWASSTDSFSVKGTIRPAKSALFEIGSITKAFTGVLLALMIEDGAVTLETPVQDLLPPHVRVPSLEGKSITLRHLTTHTSGLPRMPSNWAPADPNAPYVDYGVDQLYGFLKAHTLTRMPGEKYEYSNVGTALLGHALALKAGKSYESLLSERIFVPLGMTSTHIRSTPQQLFLLAQGYRSEKHGDTNELHEQGRWDFDVFEAAGGIRSTLQDMDRFLRANAMPKNIPLTRALLESHKPLFQVNDHLSVGMGWHISTKTESGKPIIWHNGETGGFHSFIGFNPQQEAGVVVLANTAANIDDAATAILTGLLDAAPPKN